MPTISGDPIVLTEDDWQHHVASPQYTILRCVHPEVRSRIETHIFRPGFRLVAQQLSSRQPIWHPAFTDTGYVGFCFAFCPADPGQLALSHLYHRRMNITSGYAFTGGLNLATNTPLTYVALQFSHAFLEELSAEQPLPTWLMRLTQESGIIDSIEAPRTWRDRAWRLAHLSFANPQMTRLRVESIALDWLADTLGWQLHATNKGYVDAAIEIIRMQYHDPLTISELAHRVGTNSCYLKRAFKAQTGCTINAFIVRERMRAAQHLLRERPELSIKMVAALCGYQPSYFSAQFKKYHGVSPQAFQTSR